MSHSNASSWEQKQVCPRICWSASQGNWWAPGRLRRHPASKKENDGEWPKRAYDSNLYLLQVNVQMNTPPSHTDIPTLTICTCTHTVVQVHTNNYDAMQKVCISLSSSNFPVAHLNLEKGVVFLSLSLFAWNGCPSPNIIGRYNVLSKWQGIEYPNLSNTFLQSQKSVHVGL